MVVCRVCRRRPVGRIFHDFWASNKSEIAREALDRIGKLYDIERNINGKPAGSVAKLHERFAYFPDRGIAFAKSCRRGTLHDH